MRVTKNINTQQNGCYSFLDEPTEQTNTYSIYRATIKHNNNSNSSNDNTDITQSQNIELINRNSNGNSLPNNNNIINSNKVQYLPKCSILTIKSTNMTQQQANTYFSLLKSNIHNIHPKQIQYLKTANNYYYAIQQITKNIRHIYCPSILNIVQSLMKILRWTCRKGGNGAVTNGYQYVLIHKQQLYYTAQSSKMVYLPTVKSLNTLIFSHNISSPNQQYINNISRQNENQTNNSYTNSKPLKYNPNFPVLVAKLCQFLQIGQQISVKLIQQLGKQRHLCSNLVIYNIIDNILQEESVSGQYNNHNHMSTQNPYETNIVIPNILSVRLDVNQYLKQTQSINMNQSMNNNSMDTNMNTNINSMNSNSMNSMNKNINTNNPNNIISHNKTSFMLKKTSNQQANIIRKQDQPLMNKIHQQIKGNGSLSVIYQLLNKPTSKSNNNQQISNGLDRKKQNSLDRQIQNSIGRQISNGMGNHQNMDSIDNSIPLTNQFDAFNSRFLQEIQIHQLHRHFVQNILMNVPYIFACRILASYMVILHSVTRIKIFLKRMSRGRQVFKHSHINVSNPPDLNQYATKFKQLLLKEQPLLIHLRHQIPKVQDRLGTEIAALYSDYIYEPPELLDPAKVAKMMCFILTALSIVQSKQNMHAMLSCQIMCIAACGQTPFYRKAELPSNFDPKYVSTRKNIVNLFLNGLLVTTNMKWPEY